MRNGIWGLLLLVLCARPVMAQPNHIIEAQALVRDAFAAYEAEDYVIFRDKLEAAHALRPQHPGLIYNLGAAYARTGQLERALAMLSDYVAMGLVASPQDDADFEGVWETEPFEEILDRMAQHRRALGTADTAFVLQDPAFIPEGLAYDAATDAFFVGSVHQRRIVRVDSTGVPHAFADAEDGFWSVLGMAIDPQRQWLWVCTAALPQSHSVPEEEVGRTVLIALDLVTGGVVYRAELEDETEEHQLGDVAVQGNGDVYVTDARAGALYVVRSGSERELEPVLDPGTLVSPQGVCVAEDGTLLVADYSMGLLHIDPASQTVQPMSVPAHTTLLGIDGLACTGDTVLAVQNGVRPHRVLRLQVDREASRVRRVTRIAANLPAFDEPTLGTIVGEAFYVVANSQWGHFDEEGQLPPDGTLQPPVVLRIDWETRTE